MPKALFKVHHSVFDPIARWINSGYEKHRYSTPVFVLRETLKSFELHNGSGLSASLSFYALFAIIPLALLTFFLLSHLVMSSNFAMVKLAVITSNVLPKFSNRIMIEVYNVAKHKAVWGGFGLFALFWLVTPLTSALRSAFYTISSKTEKPSFLMSKIKDALAVIGILLMFFLFTFAGLLLEKSIHRSHAAAIYASSMNMASSIVLSAFFISIFYRFFFPIKIAYKHIILGALLTAVLWMLMRPLLSVFLTINASYSSIFGGMKNMFLAIGWLYYTFAVFILGTEFIATLHKKDVLLLRSLFYDTPQHIEAYLNKLMKKYGKTFAINDYVFKAGDQDNDLYYIVSGRVHLSTGDKILRRLEAGDYFGEMAMFTEASRFADARVVSDEAKIIIISAKNIETLLIGEPKVALNLLKTFAKRLHHSDIQRSHTAN